MALPDLIFYAKLVAELVNSWDVTVPPPSWASLGMQYCIRYLISKLLKVCK